MLCYLFNFAVVHHFLSSCPPAPVGLTNPADWESDKGGYGLTKCCGRVSNADILSNNILNQNIKYGLHIRIWDTTQRHAGGVRSRVRHAGGTGT